MDSFPLCLLSEEGVMVGAVSQVNKKLQINYWRQDHHNLLTLDDYIVAFSPLKNEVFFFTFCRSYVYDPFFHK